MITLYGHGYVGTAIAEELERQQKAFKWLHHGEELPDKTGIIVNAAGYVGKPNVDACEKNRVATVHGNVAWAWRLVEERKPVIHISSGCVYSGSNEGKGWKESDVPNFRGSWYSIVKQVEEDLLRPYLGESYVLRIRMPFGKASHPRNLITKLREYPKLLDGVNSLSRIEDVARVAVWFAEKRPSPGVYNLCNPGAVSTREIASIMGLEKEWFSPGEFKAQAERSACVLNVEKMLKVFPLPEVQEALKECLG